jgi:hypothetical protein
MWIIDLLITCHSPHLGAPARLFTPTVLQIKERTPIHYPSDVSTFGLAIESIKEFGGAPQLINRTKDLNLWPLTCYFDFEVVLVNDYYK